MAVLDQLASLRTGVGEPQTIHNVVQPTLESNQEVSAGDAFLAVRSLEEEMKLFLGKAVDALDLLLLSQLDAIVGDLTAATLAVFSRRIGSSVESAFVGVASIPFKKKLYVFTPANPAVRSHMIGQNDLPLNP
jgi:hypothetical protein